MIELDLQRDTPEDFEGRIVVVDGGRYRIGAFIAEGYESFVYKLINVRSGLALHVIKIIREQQAVDEWKKAMEIPIKLKENDATTSAVPDMRLLELHGGIFQMQDNFSGWSEDTESIALLRRAGVCLNRRELKKAEKIYNRVLKRHPDNTFAMGNLAVTLTAMGRLIDAMATWMKVLIIEPNFCEYYRQAIPVARKCQRPRLTIDLIENMKSKFPYACDSDVTLIEEYLNCGDAEHARGIFQASHKAFSEREMNAITTSIFLQVERSKTAAGFLQIAQGTSNGDEAIAALQKACNLDPQNPYTRANLAFRLMRNAEYRAAADLLRFVEAIIMRSALADIQFNLGIALFHAGEVEDAAILLRSAVPIQGSSPPEPITIADLPTIGIWIAEDGMLGEPHGITLLFLEELAGVAHNPIFTETLEDYSHFVASIIGS